MEIVDVEVPTVSTYFLGQTIVLQPQILGEILGLPCSGLDIYNDIVPTFDYPSGHSRDTANAFLHTHPCTATLDSFETSDLKPYVRLFTNMLHQTVLTNEGRSGFYGCTKLMAYLVMNKIHVNFPQLILRSIMNFPMKPNSHLGHGKVITCILRYVGCDLSRFAPRTSRAFDVRNIRLSKIPKPSEIFSAATSSAAPSSSAGPSSSAPAPSASHRAHRPHSRSTLPDDFEERISAIVSPIIQREVRKSENRLFKKIKKFLKSFCAVPPSSIPSSSRPSPVVPSGSSTSSGDGGNDDDDDNDNNDDNDDDDEEESQ